MSAVVIAGLAVFQRLQRLRNPDIIVVQGEKGYTTPGSQHSFTQYLEDSSPCVQNPVSPVARTVSGYCAEMVPPLTSLISTSRTVFWWDKERSFC